MKTAGLIGGIAWPSTLTYYRLINQHVQHALGNRHSARCVIVSLDFAEVYADMSAGNPAGACARMQSAARQVRAAGADLVAILANTGHFAGAEVQAAAGLPLVHIATESAQAIRAARPDLRKLGLLGTSFSLQAAFFGRMFVQEAGFELVLPTPAQQRQLDALIFGDLAMGCADAQESARNARAVNALCASLHDRGAHGVVLGCTELGVLLPHLHLPIPVYDTTDLHARAIVREMLDN